jgi:hypothetical protein
VDTTGGIATRAIAGEVRLSLFVQNCFGHDGSRRITGTQEQDIGVWLCQIPLSYLHSCVIFVGLMALLRVQHSA